MRHIIISIIATLMAMAASARQISPGEAQNIASDFFNNGSVPGKAPRSAIRVAATSPQTLTPQPYYIFNADNDAGFVIISGDDRARNILGYSDKGSFSAGKMPPQLEWLLSEYEKAIKTLPANAPSPRQYVSRSTGQTTLLSTQWGQSSPYNDKCPVVDGSRAVTGCVATAMAQVINYEKKSSRVAEIPEYWTDKVYMPNLPEYEFNFDNLDNDGIATLMLYCGQSVRMNYSPLESGAIVQDVPEALRKYFGWEQEVRFVERANFNDGHWNRMVKEEISAGHPILYSAVNESGGGHAFVIDGTSDDYFHVNWG
ncbi:MAG: C10 family peptidase [Muribaculaceae bacterium]|nr:C10 family peptidase [Muribaculaceae bacterium]